MRIVLLLVMLAFSTEFIAQSRPSLMLEDMNESSLELKCFCTPGVRNKTRSKGIELSYQYLGAGEIRSLDNRFSEPYPEYSKFRKLRAKMTLPVIRTNQFKALVSYSYEAEQFELSDIQNDFQEIIGSVDDLSFKTSTFSTGMTYSHNEVNYLAGKFSISYQGNYRGAVDFSSRYAVYSGALAYGIKKDEDNEWGGGLAYSRNFRSQGFRLLPFVFWNKTFDDNWGFQITFPASYQLRYNVDPKTILIAGANYNGESYSFDQVFNNTTRSIAFNHAEVLTLLKLERQIVPWLWLDIQAGYHFNFDTNFELQATRESLIDVDPGNSVLIKFGVFISPPDSFL